MQDSKSLPDLRVLPTNALRPHEDWDPRRVASLKDRLLEDGILKNPPVVAPIQGSQLFVVLDGANRSMAFQEARIPHIVAQVVDYHNPDVRLDTWNHVVAHMPLHEFEQRLLGINTLIAHECNLEVARASLASGRCFAYILGERSPRKLEIRGDQQDSIIHMLSELVNIYRGRADIYRASNDIWEIQKPYYPGVIALIVFPRLSPEIIIQAGMGKEKIPSGITRHIIQARALNINFPIDVLRADTSLAHKREKLQEWLLERMASNAIRYYAESTFTFNE